MFEKEEWIKAKGVKLYTKQWLPDGEIIATLLFLHGLGEHIGRYNEIFKKFTENGIKVGSFDQRGFGQTVRMNGYHGRPDAKNGFLDTLDDIDRVSSTITMPDIPHFVMGQSMGGGLALFYAHHRPKGLCGVIACSPAIRPGRSTRPNFLTNFLLNTIFRSHLRTLVIPTMLDVKNLSRNPDEVKKYVSDPLNHGFGSLGLMSDLIAQFGELETKHFKNFNLPLLISHGTEDTLTSHESSKNFYEKVPSVDKTFNSYEGYFHELHNEPEGDEIVQEYINWILERSK
jgi:acylglycerol lipase